MEEGEIICNHRRCRRILNGVAWVTFCSHIFCDDDGSQLCQVPNDCKACGAKLTVKSDVVKVDLDPTEQFKSMILAGLKPEVVMEVCHRALNFWSYQMEQERNFQQHIANRLRERLQEVQTYYEQQLRCRDDQLDSFRRQLDGCRQDLDKFREQKETINEKLGEKNRQYQRLQSMYDSLRKRTGSSMTDDWLNYHGNSVSAISIPTTACTTTTDKPPLSSMELMQFRNPSSFMSLQPPPLPYLDLASTQPSSMTSGFHHKPQCSGSGMELLVSGRGVNNASLVTYPGNPDWQVSQSIHHNSSLDGPQQHQLSIVPGSASNSFIPPSCFQQHPPPTFPQLKHNHPAPPTSLAQPVTSHPPPSNKQFQDFPQPYQPVLPLESSNNHHHQLQQEPSPNNLQLDLPVKGRESHNASLVPLKPITFDDFVFAPILNNNHWEGGSTRRSRSNSDRNQNTGKETRRHV